MLSKAFHKVQYKCSSLLGDAKAESGVGRQRLEKNKKSGRVIENGSRTEQGREWREKPKLPT